MQLLWFTELGSIFLPPMLWELNASKIFVLWSWDRLLNCIIILNKQFHHIVWKCTPRTQFKYWTKVFVTTISHIFALNTNTLLYVLYIKWVAVTQIWCDLAAPQGPTNVGGDLTDNVFRATLQQGCFEGQLNTRVTLIKGTE